MHHSVPFIGSSAFLATPVAYEQREIEIEIEMSVEEEIGKRH
jgi:hypothetical protein